MFARNVLKVLYSPIKAFGEIIEKPDVKGPLLILVFTVIATLVAQYAILSRISFETGTNGYTSLLTKDVLYCRGGLVDYLISAPISFFLKWILFFGALWVTNKVFGHQTGPWKRFLVVVGYLFIVGVVYLFAIAALYSTLPELRLPAEAWNYWNPEVPWEEANQTFNEIIAPEMQKVWNPTMTSQLLLIVSYLYFPFDGWTIIISVVAVRSLCKVTWKRAAVTSAVAYIVYFLLRFFITG